LGNESIEGSEFQVPLQTLKLFSVMKPHFNILYDHVTKISN